MQIRDFYPSSGEPSAVLILPNHLGSSFESDFTGRAELLAESLGMLVLAYERPGTGKGQSGLGVRSLRPSRAIQLASQTGRDLEARLDNHIRASGLQVILTGNSAAGAEAIMVARSETLQADYLIAADPVGIQEMTRAEFRRNWAQHQRIEEQLKADDPQDQTGSDGDANSGVVGKLLLGKRFLRDVGLYGDIWRSSIVHDALGDIAESDDFSDLATNVAFVEHTFTGSSVYMREVVNELNTRQQRAATAAVFKATFMPAIYHSYFNSALNYADFIGVALAEITTPSTSSTT